MHKIEIKQFYYAFNTYENKLYKIGDYNSLIRWINGNDLKNFGLNPNDTYCISNWNSFTEKYEYKRCFVKWIIYDKDLRVIDARDYIQDIDKELLSNFWYRRNKKNKKNLPDFRRGPVPGTGHNYHWNIRVRHPKTTAELRSNCIEEHKFFVRGKRRNLPTLYDDIFTKNGKSWKDCTRKRKQWMK